jgi:hypothetical protein
MAAAAATRPAVSVVIFSSTRTSPPHHQSDSSEPLCELAEAHLRQDLHGRRKDPDGDGDSDHGEGRLDHPVRVLGQVVERQDEGGEHCTDRSESLRQVSSIHHGEELHGYGEQTDGDCDPDHGEGRLDHAVLVCFEVLHDCSHRCKEHDDTTKTLCQFSCIEPSKDLHGEREDQHRTCDEDHCPSEGLHLVRILDGSFHDFHHGGKLSEPDRHGGERLGERHGVDEGEDEERSGNDGDRLGDVHQGLCVELPLHRLEGPGNPAEEIFPEEVPHQSAVLNIPQAQLLHQAPVEEALQEECDAAQEANVDQIDDAVKVAGAEGFLELVLELLAPFADGIESSLERVTLDEVHEGLDGLSDPVEHALDLIGTLLDPVARSTPTRLFAEAEELLDLVDGGLDRIHDLVELRLDVLRSVLQGPDEFDDVVLEVRKVLCGWLDALAPAADGIGDLCERRPDPLPIFLGEHLRPGLLEGVDELADEPDHVGDGVADQEHPELDWIPVEPTDGIRSRIDPLCESNEEVQDPTVRVVVEAVEELPERLSSDLDDIHGDRDDPDQTVEYHSDLAQGLLRRLDPLEEIGEPLGQIDHDRTQRLRSFEEPIPEGCSEQSNDLGDHPDQATQALCDESDGQREGSEVESFEELHELVRYHGREDDPEIDHGLERRGHGVDGWGESVEDLPEAFQIWCDEACADPREGGPHVRQRPGVRLVRLGGVHTERRIHGLGEGLEVDLSVGGHLPDLRLGLPQDLSDGGCSVEATCGELHEVLVRDLPDTCDAGVDLTDLRE